MAVHMIMYYNTSAFLSLRLSFYLGGWGLGVEELINNLNFIFYTYDVKDVHIHDFDPPVIDSTDASPFSITIDWNSPQINGDVIAFEVSYWPTLFLGLVTRVNTTNLAPTITVSGLDGNTQYTFVVRPYTRDGAGESTMTTVTTADRPSKRELATIANSPRLPQYTLKHSQTHIRYMPSLEALHLL